MESGIWNLESGIWNLETIEIDDEDIPVPELIHTLNCENDIIKASFDSTFSNAKTVAQDGDNVIGITTHTIPASGGESVDESYSLIRAIRSVNSDQVIFDQRGDYIAITDGDDTASLFDLTSIETEMNNESMLLPTARMNHTARITKIDFSPNNLLLGSSTIHEDMHVWDMSDFIPEYLVDINHSNALKSASLVVMMTSTIVILLTL